MAEIIYSDGRKETVAPPPPEGVGEIRAPTKFEQYRSARQNIFEKPLKAIGVPAGAAEATGEFFTPQTTAEQGIEIGLAGMPFAGKVAGPLAGPLMQRGLRYAMPAVGGALGSLASAPSDLGHAGWEFARGLGYGVGGDVLPFAKGLLGRSKALEKADEAAVGKAVSKSVPAFGKASTKADLDAIAVRGRGPAALDTARTDLMDSTIEALQGSGTEPRYKRSTSLDVPALAKLAGGGNMPFQDAVDWLAKLGDRGWLMTNQMATGLDAATARALREQARKEIVAGLNTSKPGLGETFDKGMNELAKGHYFIQLLQQPGVIAEGKLNMNALRDTMGKMATQKQTYSQRLEKLASPEDVKAFYDALSRGSGDLVSRDVKGNLGLSFGAGAGASLGPGIHINTPKLPKRVGQVPPIQIGPGGTPASLGLLGLSREAVESEQR